MKQIERVMTDALKIMTDSIQVDLIRLDRVGYNFSEVLLRVNIPKRLEAL